MTTNITPKALRFDMITVGTVFTRSTNGLASFHYRKVTSTKAVMHNGNQTSFNVPANALVQVVSTPQA